MIKKVTSEEVVNVLRDIATGKYKPQLLSRVYAWDLVITGIVKVEAGGYSLEILIDEGTWDSTDRVTAPDGRTGEFKDWVFEKQELNHPDDVLALEDINLMNQVILIIRNLR